MLLASWEVCIGKNCARGLECGLRPQAKGHAQDRGHSFPNTGQPRPANNFFLSGKLLYKKYLCRLFTEAVSHHACAFDVLVKQTRVVYRSN